MIRHVIKYICRAYYNPCVTHSPKKWSKWLLSVSFIIIIIILINSQFANRPVLQSHRLCTQLNNWSSTQSPLLSPVLSTKQFILHLIYAIRTLIVVVGYVVYILCTMGVYLYGVYCLLAQTAAAGPAAAATPATSFLQEIISGPFSVQASRDPTEPSSKPSVFTTNKRCLLGQWALVQIQTTCYDLSDSNVLPYIFLKITLSCRVLRGHVPNLLMYQSTT